MGKIMVGDEARAAMGRDRPIMMVGVSLILIAWLSGFDGERRVSAATTGKCSASIRSVAARGADQQLRLMPAPLASKSAHGPR